MTRGRFLCPPAVAPSHFGSLSIDRVDGLEVHASCLHEIQFLRRSMVRQKPNHSGTIDVGKIGETWRAVSLPWVVRGTGQQIPHGPISVSGTSPVSWRSLPIR